MNYFFKFFFIFVLNFSSIIVPIQGMPSTSPGSSHGRVVPKLEALVDEACQYILENLRFLETAKHTATRYREAMQELAEKIKNDTQQFLTEEQNDKSDAVVFDIDGTTLHSMESFTLMNPHTAVFEDDNLPEIPEMLNLCKYFAEKKCRIIFLTAREQEAWRAMTMKNLLTKNYIVHAIRFLPTDLAQEVQEHVNAEDTETPYKIIAQWKCSEIEDIMQQYNVVAFIDDSEDNVTEVAETLGRNKCFRVPLPQDFA